MKLYRGLKKGETWPLCISPNVLQNNPIKLLFQAFCSQLEPSSSSFFFKEFIVNKFYFPIQCPSRWVA